MTTQTATRERPILFSGDMVRAILAGRKTQTRRVIKPQPDPRGCNGGLLREVVPSLLLNRGDLFDVRYDGDNPRAIRCPYGWPGDRLWVRETCAIEDVSQPNDDRPSEHFRARVACLADGGIREIDVHIENWRVAYEKVARRSAIHMPRWASRITLEITGVQVERLQEISYRDCIAEGMPPVPCYDDGAEPETILRAIRDKYRALWDDLNGTRAPWESNPFVWCISFRRIRT